MLLFDFCSLADNKSPLLVKDTSPGAEQNESGSTQKEGAKSSKDTSNLQVNAGDTSSKKTGTDNTQTTKDNPAIKQLQLLAQEKQKLVNDTVIILIATLQQK